jgi:hypothetical protein
LQKKKREISTHIARDRIVLIGDSAANVRALLGNNFELYSVVKPGYTSSDLRETAKKRH